MTAGDDKKAAGDCAIAPSYVCPVKYVAQRKQYDQMREWVWWRQADLPPAVAAITKASTILEVNDVLLVIESWKYSGGKKDRRTSARC